jgi:hypothetical protein
VSRSSTIRNSFQRIITMLLYRSHSCDILFINWAQILNIWWYVPTNHGFCSLEITRLYQPSFQLYLIFRISWLIPKNFDYFIVHNTQIKQPSKQLFSEIQLFVIRSNELNLLDCEVLKAMKTFMSVVSRNSTFRDSFRCIVIILLYRSRLYKTFNSFVSRNLIFRYSFKRAKFLVLYRSQGPKDLVSVVSKYSTFRDSFERFGTIVQ